MKVNRAGIILFVACALSTSAYGDLDQEQTVYDGGLSARTLPGYTVWQSFTAGMTGRLTQIEMGFFNDMNGRATLEIFEGDGTEGTRLQSLTVSIFGVTGGGVTWNSWSVNVDSEAGRMYTFNITPDAATLPDPYGVCVGMSDPYPGGVLGLNDPSGSYRTDMDAVFRTYVTPVPEPASIVVLGCCLLGGLLRRARRR